MTTQHLRRRGAIVAIAAAAGALVVGVSAPASASTPTQTVRWTQIGIYPRTGPSLNTPRAGVAVPDGTRVTVYCETNGDPVTSNAATNDTVWARTSIGYLPNAFLDSGADGRTPGVPDCAGATASGSAVPTTIDAGAYGIKWTVGQVASTSGYNRQAAARWALSNFATWNGGLKAGDCTWFTSTVLHSGAGWGTTADWTDRVSAWDFGRMASRKMNGGPSKDFADAQAFQDYLVRTEHWAQISEVTGQLQSGQPLPSDAQVGDIVQFDFENAHKAFDKPDGTVDHTMVIVGFRDGQALVVGVDDVPTDKNGNARPNQWQYAVDPTQTMAQRYPHSRAYLIHITR